MFPPQVHAYIVSYLKKEMPSLFGREKKKEELIMRLPEIYTILQREHHISPGDFPNVTKMQVEEPAASSPPHTVHWCCLFTFTPPSDVIRSITSDADVWLMLPITSNPAW